MSILIKGMKMPKNCKDCGIVCEPYISVDGLMAKWARNESVRDNCPLIEVPNPNINADELIVGYQVMKKKDGVKYSFLENGLIRMTEVENVNLN